MKQFLFLITLLSINFFVTGQQTDLTLTKGTKLTYEVEQGTKAYQFIMKITELGKTVSFDWEMTAPINKSGSVKMTAEAMKSATALFNYFNDGQTVLAEETSAFISRDAYKSIEDNKSVTLSANGKNGAAELFEVLNSSTSEKSGSFYIDYIKPVNGKDLTFETHILENADGKKAIRVWKNAEFPLIIFMETDFKIYLTSIEQ
ncbi:MAG: hypothetical protein IPM85_00815 [Chitinophagaceae bacterium]|nr:hypothetical protein [Chitinophagaceae bacterium]